MNTDELMLMQWADNENRKAEAARPLLDRLAEIMPKHVTTPEPLKEDELMRPFKDHLIRRHADAFTGWLNGALPKTHDEMTALLWTFGEIVHGELERRLDLHVKLNNDWLSKFIQPQTMKVTNESSSPVDQK